MATPLSASQMVSALKKEGVRVKEYRSWRTHNRNHKGAWGGVNGVMIHHTVSSGESSSVALCYNGHSSLPGPLCHAVGGKSGTVYLVGNGRANHAGLGDDDVLDAVVAERSLPADNEANTDGNRRFYGIEIVNLGNGRDVYTREQYDAAVRWAAGICRAHGWSAKSVIGHKEWQPGKIDPHGPVEGRGAFDMDEFRRDVQRRLDGSAGSGSSTPTPTEEDPLAGYSKKDIAEAVWKTDGVHDIPARWRESNPANEQWQPESVNAFIGDRVLDVRAEVRALDKKVDALTAKLDEIDLDGFVAALESLKIVASLDVTE